MHVLRALAEASENVTAGEIGCTQCVAVCCSVWQCVAVCCSVLQCVAVCCSVLQCVEFCCNSVVICLSRISIFDQSQ